MSAQQNVVHRATECHSTLKWVFFRLLQRARSWSTVLCETRQRQKGERRVVPRVGGPGSHQIMETESRGWGSRGEAVFSGDGVSVLQVNGDGWCGQSCSLVKELDAFATDDGHGARLYVLCILLLELTRREGVMAAGRLPLPGRFTWEFWVSHRGCLWSEGSPGHRTHGIAQDSPEAPAPPEEP